MNDKEANIDLLFRNGLKDFEVLPPPGVWDGIHSSIKIKSQPHIFLRVAAAVTVLLALGFLTYRWTRDLSVGSSGSLVAFNVPASSPVISDPVVQTQNLIEKKSYPVNNPTDILIENDSQIPSPEVIETISAPEEIINIKETKNLFGLKNDLMNGTFQSSLNKSQGSSLNIKYSDLQYIPENVTPKPQNKWSIAALASPTYYSSFSSGSDALSKQLNATEQSLVSYSAGLALSYKVSKRFSIQSGLYYSSLGQTVDGINSFGGFQKYDNSKGARNFEVLTSVGTVYTNNPDVYLSSDIADRVLTAYTSNVFDPKKANLQPISNSLDQNFSYLELPVVLRYKLVDKTIGINLIGGLSYNMLVNNSVYTTVDGNKYFIGKTEGLNPLTLSSSLGMGMEYNFSSKLSLNLEPTFRYFLNPFSVTTGSYSHPYSFGIFSGVSYKF